MDYFTNKFISLIKFDVITFFRVFLDFRCSMDSIDNNRIAAKSFLKKTKLQIKKYFAAIPLLSIKFQNNAFNGIE